MDGRPEGRRSAVPEAGRLTGSLLARRRPSPPGHERGGTRAERGPVTPDVGSRLRYPFVLLDAGETLFGPRESFGAVYARVLRGMGLDRRPEAFEDGIRRAWRALEEIVPRGVDRYAFFAGGEDGYWLRFARQAIELAAARPLPDGFVERALRPLRQAFREPSAWLVFPEVREALATIRLRGARLAVVSNWDSRLPYLLDVLDLGDYFDLVVASHLVGVEKPEPAIFRHALAGLGADPRMTLHVGDLPEIDLDGARAAGIDSVLVDRRSRLDPALCAIADLSELPRIVEVGLGP